MTRTAVRRTAALSALAAIGASLLVGTAVAGGATPPARDDDGLSAVRNATAKFQDVDVALAFGYEPVSGCEVAPNGAGAMGIHFLNKTLAGDGKVVATQPEVLLYEQTGDGLTLVGVEYFVAEAAAGGRRPTVLGRAFNGPMAGHNDYMPSHYDLHVWAWKHNPAGVTATWNASVHCNED